MSDIAHKAPCVITIRSLLRNTFGFRLIVRQLEAEKPFKKRNNVDVFGVNRQPRLSFDRRLLCSLIALER
jgi:hypothetical protein